MIDEYIYIALRHHHEANPPLNPFDIVHELFYTQPMETRKRAKENIRHHAHPGMQFFCFFLLASYKNAYDPIEVLSARDGENDIPH